MNKNNALRGLLVLVARSAHAAGSNLFRLRRG